VGEDNPEKQETNRKRKSPPKGFVDQMYKPGQSGNPAGRPKRKSMVELMQEFVDDQKLSDGTTGDAIPVKLWFKFMSKHWPAFKEYLDRRDGKVNSDLDNALADGSVPIKGTFTFTIGDKDVTK